MLILTAAIDYGIEEVRPFMESLNNTAYDGRIACICNGSEAQKYLEAQGVEIIQDIENGHPVNSRRFFLWKEVLRGYDDVAIIADIRDIVFQRSLYDLPSTGLHVYCEDESMTLGTCPYNDSWLTTILGTNPYKDRPIICAGFTLGRLTEYCMTMWSMLKELPATHGLDQGVHNHLIYSGRVPALVHMNPDPVYTVGYIRPHNNVIIEDGIIKGDNGVIPHVVHQYDRHPNLKENIKWQ